MGVELVASDHHVLEGGDGLICQYSDSLEADGPGKSDRCPGGFLNCCRSCQFDFRNSQGFLKLDLVDRMIAAHQHSNRLFSGRIQESFYEPLCRNFQEGSHFFDAAAIRRGNRAERKGCGTLHAVRRQDVGAFDIGGERAAVAVYHRLFAGLREDHELMRGVPSDEPGVRFDGSKCEAASGKDPVVGVVHFLIVFACSGVITVEAVGVFHQELAAPHQAEARADLVAEFGLDLVEIQRELPIGFHFPPKQIGDDLFMRGAQAEIPFVPVFEAQQLFPVEVPPAGFFPELCRRGHGHQEFLCSGAVHFVANDLFHLADDTQAEREIGIDAGRDLSNQTGAQHEPVADCFSLTGGFP